MNECTYTTCIDVEEVSSQTPILIYSAVTSPCPGATNGSINITVSGGRPPYSYFWQGPDIIAFAGEDQSNLGEGVYTVSVTDYCGATAVSTITVLGINIQTPVTPGCAGQGTISAQVTGGGTPPYSFVWFDPPGNFSSTQATVNNVKSGEYCVKVTDAAGCTASKCLTLLNSEVLYEIEKSCSKMSNGSVTLHILNPNSESVSVFFDGAIVYSNPFAPAQLSIPVSNLPAGTFDVMWDVGACSQSQASSTVQVGEESVSHEYVSYEDGKCTFQDFCRGEIIPGSTTITDPTVHYWEAEGTNIGNIWSSRCKVPTYCDNVPVADEKFRIKKLRVGQYLALVNANPNISGEVAYQIEQQTGGHDNCDWVNFCPATMDIFGFFPDINPAPGPMSGAGNGCWNLQCGLDNEDFCVNNLANDIYPEGVYGEELFSCNAGSATLKELISWHETMPSFYPEYEGSELQTYVEANLNSEVAACAYVRFCWSDHFKVLEYPDLPNIICDNVHIILHLPGGYQWNWITPLNPLPNIPLPVIINSCQPIPTTSDDGCELRACVNPNSSTIIGFDEFDSPVYGDIIKSCDTPQPPGFTGGSLDERLVFNPGTGRDFYNFGQTVFMGIPTPKGLVREGNSAFYYLDYISTGRRDRYMLMPENEMFIDDWDKNQLLFIQSVEEGKKYAVKTDAEDESNWIKVVSADQLSVTLLEKLDTCYYVGGQFSGTLKIDEQPVNISSTASAYLIKFSPQGQIISRSTINNLEGRSTPVFHKTPNGISLTAVGGGGGINIDGNSVSSLDGSVVTIISDGGSSLVTDNILRIDTNLILIRSGQNKEGSLFTYLFKGIGHVFNGSQTLHTDGTNDLFLVTTGVDGELKWTQKISADHLDIRNLDISYLDNGNLVLGVTFTDSVSIQNRKYYSTGETDIALYSFDQSGTVLWSEKYGSLQQENIEKMYYSNGKLYFGGEFSGNIYYRQIGETDFLTFTNSISNPYIAFVNEADITTANRSNIRERDNSISKARVTSVSVYPNPFTDNLMLGLTTEKEENLTIKLYNSSGALIHAFKRFSPPGFNEIDIATGLKLPPGIYFVEVQSDNIIARQFKVVKQKD